MPKSVKTALAVLTDRVPCKAQSLLPFWSLANAISDSEQMMRTGEIRIGRG